MIEQFERLYLQPGQYFFPQYGIIIKAGALLRDKETSSLLIQLKIQNISHKNIRSIKIAIDERDTAGKSLNSRNTYSYLDLNLRSGEYIGEQVAIPVVSKEVRCFDIEVLQVVFSGGEVIEETNITRHFIPKQKTLEEYFHDNGLLTLYKNKSGTKGKLLPFSTKDGWFCSCGMLNKEENERCTKCGSAKERLFKYLDTESLESIKNQENEEAYQKAITLLNKPKGKLTDQERSDARILLQECSGYKDADLKIEEIDEESRRKEAEEKNIKKKKIIKYAIITTIIVLSIGAVSYPFIKSVNDKNVISEAVKLGESDSYNSLSKAIALLEKASPDQTIENTSITVSQAKKIYETASIICGEYTELSGNSDIYALKILPVIQLKDKNKFLITLDISAHVYNHQYNALMRRYDATKVSDEAERVFTATIDNSDQVTLEGMAFGSERTFKASLTSDFLIQDTEYSTVFYNKKR